MPEVFYVIWTGEYLCSDLCGAKFLWVLETFYEIYWAEQKLCKEKWLMLLRYFSQVWVNISTPSCLMWSTTLWLFLLLHAASFFFPCLSGTTSIFCEHHLLVCSCYFRLYLLMVLVSFFSWLCLFLFTNSKCCHIFLGTRPWICSVVDLSLGQTCLGALAMVELGDTVSTSSSRRDSEN